jgi:hypothetical protein
MSFVTCSIRHERQDMSGRSTRTGEHGRRAERLGLRDIEARRLDEREPSSAPSPLTPVSGPPAPRRPERRHAELGRRAELVRLRDIEARPLDNHAPSSAP